MPHSRVDEIYFLFRLQSFFETPERPTTMAKLNICGFFLTPKYNPNAIFCRQRNEPKVN